MNYRRRMPKALRVYVHKKEILKVVNSKEEALVIDAKVNNALHIAESSLTDSSKSSLIKEALIGLVEVQEKANPVRLSEAVKKYLAHSAVSDREKKNRVYFFNDLLPSLVKYVYEDNPVVSEITPVHLNQIATIIQQLPSRNHLNLKKIGSYDLIVNSINGEYKNDKGLHVETINKMIKRIRSLALFGFRTGLFNMTTAIATVKNISSARDQRKALTCSEIDTIYNATKHPEVKNFIILLRYTGMRVGELAKYKIKIIDGVECFDLRDADMLKTRSSFRVIPKHPKVKVVEFSYTLEHLSRQVKILIDKHLDDTAKKTTYSIRHTFASTLITKGARSDMVSELLGHKHAGMTLSRYAKGFSVEQLNEVVQLL